MNFKTLDLNLLRVFDAVMEERSLTRAALRLSLPLPLRLAATFTDPATAALQFAFGDCGRINRTGSARSLS